MTIKRFLAIIFFASISSITFAQVNIERPDASYEVDKQICADVAGDVYQSTNRSAQMIIGSAIFNGIGQSIQIAKCMQGKGWLIGGDKDDEVRIKNAQNKIQAYDKFNTAIDEISNDPIFKKFGNCDFNELKPYLIKSTCLAKDLAPENIADKTKASATEKLSIEFLGKISNQQLDRLRILYLTKDPKKNAGAALAQVYSELMQEGNENRLNLYMGKITWGEYNQRRRLINEKFNNNFSVANNMDD